MAPRWEGQHAFGRNPACRSSSVIVRHREVGVHPCAGEVGKEGQEHSLDPLCTQACANPGHLFCQSAGRAQVIAHAPDP